VYFYIYIRNEHEYMFVMFLLVVFVCHSLCGSTRSMLVRRPNTTEFLNHLW
jgi:hypothetical protein